jgi:hypothetical protein
MKLTAVPASAKDQSAAGRHAVRVHLSLVVFLIAFISCSS